MRVTPHPLHRSGHAELPHPAPPLGHDAKAHERVRVTEMGHGKPPGDEPSHACRGDAGALTAASQDTAPASHEGRAEGRQRASVHGHAVIPDVPAEDRTQVGPNFRDGPMQALTKHGPGCTGCMQHETQDPGPLAKPQKPSAPVLRGETRLRPLRSLEDRRLADSATRAS